MGTAKAAPVPARRRARAEVPPLEHGDFLTRAEFDRRYEAHGDDRKCELIDGVVYVSSPVSARHGDPHSDLVTWLGLYKAHTPGVRSSDNATLRLDEESVPQPDACLRIERGGRTTLDANGYLSGCPELVVEVAASSASYDLHQKQAVYRRHGCPEYLVLVVREPEVRWLALRDGVYEPLAPDRRGVLRSTVFPGLWLDGPALLAGDAARLLRTLEAGLRSKPHAAFVRSLSRRRRRREA